MSKTLFYVLEIKGSSYLGLQLEKMKKLLKEDKYKARRSNREKKSPDGTMQRHLQRVPITRGVQMVEQTGPLGFNGVRTDRKHVRT
jgi:hypothetical protein